MQTELLLRSLKVVGVFILYILLLRKFKYPKLTFIYDLIVSLGGLLLLVGVPKQDYFNIGKHVFLALLIFYFLRVSLNRVSDKISSIILAIVQIAYLIVPIINFVYYCQSGQGIGPDAMFAITQTNFSEAMGFLRGMGAVVPVISVAFVLTYIVFYLINIKLKHDFSYNISKRVQVLFTVLLCIVVWYDANRVVAKSQLYEAYSKSKQFLNAIRNHQSPKDLVAFNADNRMKNIVIVIGESANREYFSLYGYDKKTTPWLDSMESNKNFLKFNHAYSCNKFTTKVLAMAFAEKNQYNNISKNNEADLIDVFHKAGYKVWWISNQGKKNNLHESSTSYAFRSDKTIFTKVNGSAYDEKLLDYLPKKLTEKGNVIFIHQIGSHGGYRDRFPKRFKKEFIPINKESMNDINAYLDSILYTDYVLQKIFAKGCKDLNMDVFMYFSDHGEKPGVPRDRFAFPMSRIPLVIYFSPEYKEKHIQIFNNIHCNIQKYFTNDLIYDTILGIADIDTNHISNTYNLASDKYRLTRELAITEYGKVKLSEEN